MMDAPIAAGVVACCLIVGGITGAIEKLGNSMYYDAFISNPDNFHLVDDFGNPVSQEVK